MNLIKLKHQKKNTSLSPEPNDKIKSNQLAGKHSGAFSRARAKYFSQKLGKFTEERILKLYFLDGLKYNSRRIHMCVCWM